MLPTICYWFVNLTKIENQQIEAAGSGSGSVGRVVASNSRGPRFESSHRQVFILNIYCLLYWKDEKTNRGRDKPFSLYYQSSPVYLIPLARLPGCCNSFMKLDKQRLAVWLREEWFFVVIVKDCLWLFDETFWHFFSLMQFEFKKFW